MINTIACCCVGNKGALVGNNVTGALQAGRSVEQLTIRPVEIVVNSSSPPGLIYIVPPRRYVQYNAVCAVQTIVCLTDTFGLQGESVDSTDDVVAVFDKGHGTWYTLHGI